MTSPLGSIWNDGRVELLKKLWSYGLSAGQIASELGGGITRNAVIGKASRLGLTLAGIDGRPPRSRADKNADASAIERIRRKSSLKGQLSGIVHRANRARQDADPPVAPSLPKELPAEAVPLAQHKLFSELEPHHCRYPFGTPGVDLFFCGADALPGKPYCRGHFALCCPGMVGASAAERQRARVTAKRAAQEAGTTARIF